MTTRFHLRRDIDETGISGTGRVAEGVIFANGWCALVWLTQHTSCAFYTSLDEVVAIHGHGGKTLVVLEECPRCPHPLVDHWMDNCGGCFNKNCPCAAMNYVGGGVVCTSTDDPVAVERNALRAEVARLKSEMAAKP